MSDAFWVSFWLAIPQILALVLTWLSAMSARKDAARAVTKVAVIGEKVACLEKTNGNSGSHKPPDLLPK